MIWSNSSSRFNPRIHVSHTPSPLSLEGVWVSSIKRESGPATAGSWYPNETIGSVYSASNTQEAIGSPKVIHRTLITRAGDLCVVFTFKS